MTKDVPGVFGLEETDGLTSKLRSRNKLPFGDKGCIGSEAEKVVAV